MENKLVSIILPAYNSENEIGKTISSVLNQKYKNFELIIVDDGSTDNTKDVCRGFCDERVKYYFIENHGVSYARNYGISKSKGEYITFIDSDDYYETEFLFKLVNEISNADIVVCGYYTKSLKKQTEYNMKSLFFEEFNVFLEALQPRLLFNQVWNKIFKASIIKENNIKFNEDISLGEDELFVIDYCRHCKEYYVIEELLYNYVISDSGLGFKYRKNAGFIKVNIVRYIKDLYIEKNYNVDYINYHILRQYFSCLSCIMDKKNDDRFIIKIKSIKKLVSSEKYKSDINFVVHNNKSMKIKLMIFVLKRNSYILSLAGIFANLYNKLNKTINLGV